MKYSICYQTVTSESSEHDDFADHGYFNHGGWGFSLNDENVMEDIKENPDLYVIPLKRGELRGLIDQVQSLGIAYHGDFDWAYSIGPDIDYRTGEEKTYSFHISDITPSTHNRIMRLLS